MDLKHKSEFKSFDIKQEKANAISNYRRLQQITTLFRFMEMLVFLVMISKFSSQLPSAIKVSGYYFKGITFTFLSPKLVFVIGNAIILILLIESRVIEDREGNGSSDFSYDYVKSCDKSVVNCTTTVNSTTSVVAASTKRKIGRSKSESPIRVKCKNSHTHRELRRSVTEISRSENTGNGKGDTAEVEKSYLEEDMSVDDFRRTIDDFIAKRQKNLRDEEFSPMVYIEGQPFDD